MKRIITRLSFIGVLLISANAIGQVNEDLSEEKKNKLAQSGSDYVETAIGKIELPAPFSSESVSKESKIVAWPEGQIPEAPEGFKVTKFAEGLEHPRWTYVAPNGDVFVAETNDAKKSANRITMFRDKDQDGVADEKYSFLKNLNQPFGMLILGDYFYVANVDALLRFPYKEGQNSIDEQGEKILELPAGGYNHHWTRNIITNKDQDKIYITVGSSSNVGGIRDRERRA